MKRLLFTIFLHPSVFISALVAFLCLMVNVSTKELGGIAGTIVMKPDTPTESIQTAITVARIAGVFWILMFLFAFSRAWKKESAT